MKNLPKLFPVKMLSAFAIVLSVAFTLKHPFYVTVTELKYNVKAKSLEASVKVFVNDFESALRKLYDKKVDMINSKGKEREELNKLVIDYLQNHFQLKTDGKDRKFDLIGFEREEEAIWIYLEYKNCEKPKTLSLENSVLYDYINTQENIVHADIGGTKKSSKVTFPEKTVNFEF